MGDGVLVYASAHESTEQKRPQTDEIWTELRCKSKNSARNGACKFLERNRKKFLTNGGRCGKLHQVAEW